MHELALECARAIVLIHSIDTDAEIPSWLTETALGDTHV